MRTSLIAIHALSKGASENEEKSLSPSFRDLVLAVLLRLLPALWTNLADMQATQHLHPRLEAVSVNAGETPISDCSQGRPNRLACANVVATASGRPLPNRSRNISESPVAPHRPIKMRLSGR